ncbi:siderophore-interacting protein [Aeromicrobium choanae]|uniref:NADPH-dependent ferric siderophore reductase, contains FAD-binding and SIP domains n=1 Tax=Aeromicrobium choanae TaxID=1736691 RepID=A0A1T4Z609_9ACTN|nr:siderophore-interacting protein [Aeromicrobium choanae]SKB09472.1 NADPH-dependent ferric siderophore reductase, contains FAD-binding and SIP domains [Aeromicrobium choanae]
MPRTSRPLTIHPIVLRQAEVTRVVDVSPNLRRLTLAGPDLAEGIMGEGFARPAFSSTGFDDHVKMVVPPADGDLPRAGTQEERRFAWNPEVLEFTRDYTVRAWDPAVGTFDVEVVRHDHGLAAEWAFRATPGDAIAFAGPKSCAGVNHDVDWHLVAGDETALPAVARWLEEAPEDVRGHAIVEVPSEADRLDLPRPAGVTLEWLVRGEVPAGHSRQLDAAVRRFTPPSGRGFAWIAGEAMTIAPLRRYLRNELGLPKEDVEVVGYWRRTASPEETVVQPPERDDAERLVPPTPASEDTARAVLEHVHEMTELAPPIVTRVAVTLGINPAVARGADTVAALADSTGVAAERLAPLLDAMTALELLEHDGKAYRNTARGAVLMEEHSIDELDLADPANRDALALVDLLDVLRTGLPSARSGTATWRGRRAADPALQAGYDSRAADELQYVLQALAELAPVKAAGTLAVFGDAAALVASSVAAGRTVHLPGEDVADWPAHDCAVVVGALEGRTDDDALRVLRSALSSGTTVVLSERVADGADEDDHVAEHALTSLALSGLPMRTRDELTALLRRAGASEVEREVLGWGFGQLSRVLVAQA